MKLTIRGYSPLILPDELLVPMAGHFNQDTPYVQKVAARWKSKSYLNRKLPLKILCLEQIYDRAAFIADYKTYSDPMAGIGISARVFGNMGRKVILGDLDEGCRKVLAANFKNKIGAGDVLTQPLRPADMIFLDFNDFTMKRFLGKYGPVVAKAASAASKYVVINDCSLFYLRYGKSSFKAYSRMLGKEINSIEEYFRAIRPYYKTLGLHLVHASYFSETSFLLLSKTPAKLHISKVEPKQSLEGFVKVEL